MKNNFILLFLFFICEVSSQELLLHYSFDGNTLDSSTNGYDGSLFGVSFVPDRNGTPNSAAYFDGLDDYISFPNITELKPNLPISISFWVRYDSDNYRDRTVFSTSFEEDVNSGIYLTSQSTTGKYALGYGDGTNNYSSANIRSYKSDNVIDTGVWHQVLIVVNSSSNMKIYVDCEEVGGEYSGFGGDLSYSNFSGVIGKHDQHAALPAYFFRGAIDDFKYFKGEVIPDFKTPIFSGIEASICLGGDVVFPTSSDDGIEGVWSPAFDNSSVGTTTYTFTPNSNQCAIVQTHSLTVTNNSIAPIFSGIEASICLGGDVVFPTSSDDGIEGVWSPAFDNSSVGTTTYTFTPNSNQCAIVQTHSLTVTNNSIAPIFSGIEASICLGGDVVFPTSSDNGIEGVWSPAFDNSSVGTTTYTFTPNSNQCAIVQTHSLTVTNNSIAPIFSGIEASICLGGDVVFPTSSDNGIEGVWSPAFDNSSVGTTTYTFTPNSNQCAIVQTHSLTVTNNSIAPIFSGIEASICLGGDVVFPTSSDDGIEGVWSPAFDNSSVGTTTYTFTPNSNQCAIVQTHSLTVTNNSIAPIFSGIEASICLGGDVVFPTSSDDGIEGVWSPAFDNSSVGTTTYTFTPNSNQCAIVQTHSLTVTNNSIAPIFSGIDASICLGGDVVFPTSSDNGIEGVWSPAFDNSSVGTTTYTFTPNSNQCAIVQTHSLTVTNNSIAPIFSGIDASICLGGDVVFPTSSDNGIEGVWSPAFDNSSVGTTTYTFTPNSNQCAIVQTHSLTVTNNSIAPIFSGIDASICLGGDVVFPTSSDNGIEGIWSPEFDNSSVGATIYTFTPNPNQCAMTTSHTLNVSDNDKIPIFSTLKEEILVEESVVFSLVSENNISGTWSPIFDNTMVGETVYTFEPDVGQCAVPVSIKISVINDLIIPDFFTPNNDNVNDTWKIIGLQYYSKVEIYIYNRFGKVLSKLNSVSGWDGHYLGRPLSSNDYWFTLRLTDINGKNIVRKGNFSLIRR